MQRDVASDNNSEPMKPFKGLKSDTDWTTKGQTKSGASSNKLVMLMLQEMLQAFMDECLNAVRTGEQAAKQDRWMLQLPFKRRFESGNLLRIGVVCTVREWNLVQLEVHLDGASMRTVSKLGASIGAVPSRCASASRYRGN